MKPRPFHGSPIRRALPAASALLASAMALADATNATPIPSVSMPAAAQSAPKPAPAATIVDEPVVVTAGSSRLLAMPTRVETVVVAQPAVADAKPISPTDVVIVGKACGTTDIVVHLESGDSVTRRVRVELDKLDMETRLARIFGVKLQVDDIGGIVALRGSMPSVATANLVHKFMDSTGVKWTDMTRIDGLQQVQLRVRIAEANRSALRELAFSGVVGGTEAFGGVQAPGISTPFQQVSISPGGGVTTTALPVSNGQFGFNQIPVSSATTLFAGVPGANLEVYIRALSQNRYVRLLAEPNLVAISGEEAEFLVGGEFPVPVPQSAGVGNGTAITIQYKKFGVQLKFRPEVLGEGRIRLEVAPEVSELSEVGALNQNGFQIPSVIVRRSNTTVELGNGQSFAMAGLMKSKDQGSVTKVPLLGDLPGIGVLFRSVRYEQDQTELVVIVTAELVEPVSDGMDRPVPGALHQAPNDWELFMNGWLSGANDVASPVARLKSLGLRDIKGPGAWRRPDEPRTPAGDALPGGGDAR